MVALGAGMQAQEERQAFVDGCQFLGRQTAVYAPDTPLVDRPQMVDQSERLLRQTARARCERGVQDPFAARTGNRDDAYQRKPLAADHRRVAHDDAWPDAALFMPSGWIEVHQDHCAPLRSHSLSTPLTGNPTNCFAGREVNE